MMINNSNGRLFEFENTFFDNPKSYDFVDVWQIGELSLESDYEMFAHRQACNEISFIISGEGTFYTDGRAYPVKAGDIHYIAADHVHKIRVSHGQNLRFSYFGFEFNDRIRQEGLEDIEGMFSDPPVSVLRDTGNVRLVLYMLINEMYGSPSHSEIMVESYIKQVLIQVYRLFISEQNNIFIPAEGKSVIGKPVYNIINFIDQHIYEITGVKYISDQMGYSQSYISHFFKARMGITLQQYLFNKKIEASLPLLQQHKSTITQIALNLNYESAQSFGKAFKRVMHCTPTEYQKQFQERAGRKEENR